MQWNYFKLDENSNASLAMLKELWLMSSNAIQFVLQSRCHNLFCIVARHLTLASCQPLPPPPHTSLPHLSHDWANYFCVIYSSLLCIYPTKLSSSSVRAAWLGLAWPWYRAASNTETSLVQLRCLRPRARVVFLPSSPLCAIPRRTQQAAYLTGNTGCFARTYFTVGVAGEKNKIK